MDILMRPCMRFSCESNEIDIIPKVLFIYNLLSDIRNILFYPNTMYCK